MSENKVKEIFQKEMCVYTSCYCEENVWKLCQMIQVKDPSLLADTKVVFVSNFAKKVAFWCQKSGKDNKNVPVVWDYHVILIHKGQKDWLTYDLDTTLDFPTSIEDYFMKSFCPDIKKSSSYKPMFRVVDSEDFLEHFSSDRSHMKNKYGEWLADPPQYPAIVCKGVRSNLKKYINMVELNNKNFGKVFKCDEFFESFCSGSSSSEDKVLEDL